MHVILILNYHMLMEHYYNIVWADDDIDILLEDIQGLFTRNGINIIPFTSARPAIDYIRANHEFIDAIIVDAKFSKDGETFQEEGRSFPGLSMFMQELSSLRNEFQMPYPCWIFTGYGELLRDKYDKEDLAGFEDEIVRKGANYATLREWVASICDKIALTSSKEFKIRQENARLFELCTDSYLGNNTAQRLLSILDYKKSNKEALFNMMRKVLEDIMDLFVRDGLIDDITDKVSINARIRQIESTYGSHLPQYVIPSMKLLLVSSPLSHSDARETADFNDGSVPFMYESLLYTLKNLMCWLKPFIDSERVRKTDAWPDECGESSSNASNLQIGELKVSSWSVKLKSGKTVPVDWNAKTKKSWIPNTPIKVITSTNEKDRLVVKEIVGLVNS